MKSRRFKRKLVLSFAACLGASILLSYFLRSVWFYRDPVRTPAAQGSVIIAPADGQVIYIKRINDSKVVSEKLGQRINLNEIAKMPLDVDNGWLIGIYMSPLDVHYNYSPIAGRVEGQQLTRARVNLPMVDIWEYINLTYLRRAVNLFAKKYHFTNERNTIYIKGDAIDVIVVEIADKFVNKIRSFVEVGDDLELGQKLSFIERGSQVDLIVVGEAVDLKIDVGRQVYGGETVIASY